MMALMMSMRFVGQMFPSVGGLVGGWFHVGRGKGCPEAGVFCCHWGVGFCTIEADGCPEAGDLGCHSVVGLSIKADECPEAGDFCCHWGVGFWTIEADGCPGAGDFVCHLAVDLGCH